jgi:hypothetical protein
VRSENCSKRMTVGHEKDDTLNPVLPVFDMQQESCISMFTKTATNADIIQLDTSSRPRSMKRGPNT